MPVGSVNFEVPASFKIGDAVKHFMGYGFGVYDFFRGSATNPFSLSAIESPNQKDIEFTHMVSVKLGASIGIEHIKSMIKSMPDGTLWGPSSAAGISPYNYWKGQN
ncbi:MAG: hypothetical protein H0U75_02800 [Legionella sp.]|nr:hypothetical protein [Legionella sp.]